MIDRYYNVVSIDLVISNSLAINVVITTIIGGLIKQRSTTAAFDSATPTYRHL